MKTLSKYIAATTVAASLLGSAGIAFAQSTPTPTAAQTNAAPTAQTNSTPGAEQTAPSKPWDKRHANADERHGKMIDHLFTRFDPQHTGVVTIDAFVKPADERFDKIDTKHQGYIDKDELTAYIGASHPDLVDRMMKRLGTKNDGKITKDEFEKPLRKRFALLDLNDDGKITREEAELASPMAMPHDRGNHHRHDQKSSAQ
jgi:Ca2+-binding EF-hand superfamily protein